MATQTMADRPQAGELLRQWRARRGKSQLGLSLDAGVSRRHISFIEIGRSVPSRPMLIDLAAALDMPLRDRNTLLLAAVMRRSIPITLGTVRKCAPSPARCSACFVNTNRFRHGSWIVIGMW